MKKQTGVVVPLSALYTKDCASCGDFLSLKPFADFCSKTGLSVIQLLPVNDTGTHSSPYSGLSAFALHPMFIRINALPEFNDAFNNDKLFLKKYKAFSKNHPYSGRFDYSKLCSDKYDLLHLIFNHMKENSKDGSLPCDAEIDAFVDENPWIIPYAVFKNIKDEHMQASWKSWSEDLQKITKEEIRLKWQNKAKRQSHRFFVWCQMRAAEQFKEAADYVKEKGIILKGDIPILMNEDSADCWTYPEYFRQDWRAGSPPDGGNPMGQSWGFPTYDWKVLGKDGFSWWKERVRVASRYYSAFRIDHILGFFRIWASSENDTTAYLGHTIPCATISRKTLNDAGFEDDRIKWLSVPHIPTGLIEDITWNHEEAVAYLEKVCERIGSQELWLFKDGIVGDRQIYALHFSDDERKNQAVKDALASKWRDRSLVELEKNQFVPVYTFENSTPWKTLNWDEMERLRNIFKKNEEEVESEWKKQSLETLTAITKATDMIPCAEDLGVDLKIMPEVLKELNILSLKVVRWNRKWNENGQPYAAMDEYPELSVATTSVHDSSTLRQWWNQEKDSVWAFINCMGLNDTLNGDSAFTQEIAETVLGKVAECSSALVINPLQDYLFLDNTLFLENENDERINVPGSDNTFNWTYRIPVTVSELSKNRTLVNKIKKLVAKHDK